MIIKKMNRTLISRYFGFNLLGILCWFAAITLFGVQAMLTDPDAEKFKAGLFTVVTSLFFMWTIVNEFSDILLPDKKKFIIARCINWFLIPAIVIYLVVDNGVFKIGISERGSNFSAIPIIFQMYLILVFCELASWLRRDIPATTTFVRTKKTMLSLVIKLLIVLNIWLCAKFVVSWGIWYRFINTGIAN